MADRSSKDRNPLNILVGNVLKGWRTGRQEKLTQAQLGAVLGLNKAQVSLIETGKRALQLHESVRIHQVYGVSIEALLAAPAREESSTFSVLYALTPEEQGEMYRMFFRIAQLITNRHEAARAQLERERLEAERRREEGAP